MELEEPQSRSYGSRMSLDSSSQHNPMDNESPVMLQLSNSRICKDDMQVTYNCHPIMSGNEILTQQPLTTFQHLYQKFWISRGNHFSLDFHFSFHQSISGFECEILLQRLAGAFARTKVGLRMICREEGKC